jgi:hypothetical protein
MTDAIDRAKLEEALSFYDWLAHRPSSQNPHLTMIVDAAKVYVSTLPKTKMVEVWRVEYAEWCSFLNGGEWKPITRTALNETSAQEIAADYAKRPGERACIKVTGPHQQEVPA